MDYDSDPSTRPPRFPRAPSETQFRSAGSLGWLSRSGRAGFTLLPGASLWEAPFVDRCGSKRDSVLHRDHGRPGAYKGIAAYQGGTVRVQQGAHEALQDHWPTRRLRHPTSLTFRLPRGDTPAAREAATDGRTQPDSGVPVLLGRASIGERYVAPILTATRTRAGIVNPCSRERPATAKRRGPRPRSPTTGR